MRNRLLSRQLPHLIEENVQLELGAEVLEPAVTEGLDRAIGNEGTQKIDILSVASQVWVVVWKWLLLLLCLLAGIHLPSHRIHYMCEHGNTTAFYCDTQTTNFWQICKNKVKHNFWVR